MTAAERQRRRRQRIREASAAIDEERDRAASVQSLGVLPEPQLWLPDWRSTDGYPEPSPEASAGTPSRCAWRWEFQRRDPEYRREWAAFAANKGAGFDRRYWIGTWGLRDPIDPATAEAPVFHELRFHQFAPVGWGDQTVAIKILPEGKALVEFDITGEQPFDWQWEGIRLSLISALPQNKANIEAKPNRHKRNYHWEPKRWLRYLRLLDARATDATKEEIARVLYPGVTNDEGSPTLNNRLRDDASAARKLLHGGYRRWVVT